MKICCLSEWNVCLNQYLFLVKTKPSKRSEAVFKILFFQIRGRVLSIPSKHPGQTLVETSVEEKVFAIVMGTRGLSKLKKALLGSTSDYMMAHSEIPVIVVRKKD